MVFINPGDIKEGKQASIFPGSKITYETFDADSNLNLQYFTLLSEDESDANHVSQLFAKEDVQANIEEVSPISFRAGMLFSTLNLSFFLLLAVLLFLSIAAYYVHRLKEIGILKLNGWTEWNMTVHLIAPLLVQIYISMLDLLWALNQQSRTVIMVSHDPNAFRYCTRIVKIENQGLVDASPKKVENGDK